MPPLRRRSRIFRTAWNLSRSERYIITRSGNSPDVYRERLAAGFQKKDRLAPERIVPKDGMHKALASYARHLSARHSPLIAEEEKELFHAMIELAEKMAELYHTMQRRTMGLAEHGE